jgi:energy-converting hydrogenase Eha subunit A
VAGAATAVTLVVLIGYTLGAVAGWAFARSERIAPVWRLVIRTQLILVSVFVSFLAAWRLNGFDELAWPLIGGALALALLASARLVTPRGPERPGRAALRGWAALPNGGYWVIPIATAIAGAPGAVVAVLMDRVFVAIAGGLTWQLRRYAPIEQRARTSWIDQAPVIALGLGLLLNVLGDAPAWTEWALLWTAPVLALTGAAVFVGSALHPSQRIAWRPGLRAWASLSLVRIGLFLPIVLIAPDAAIAIVFALCAFTIPTFFPPQLSVLYGYRDSVVAASVRWGWAWAPLGVVLAVILWSRG